MHTHTQEYIDFNQYFQHLSLRQLEKKTNPRPRNNDVLSPANVFIVLLPLVRLWLMYRPTKSTGVPGNYL